MAHSCRWCSCTEIDSRSKTEYTSDGPYKYMLMIKFRGTKVFRGARAGCSFFRNALVDSRLKAKNAKYWTYEIRFYPVEKGSKYDIFRGSESWVCVDKRRKEGKTYGVMAEPGNSAARYIRYRPLNLHLAWVSSIQWISTRIAECDNSHEETCEPRRITLKPARLLQIIADGTTMKLRLCSATGEERYSAVSYCWGVVQQTVLTSSVRETWSSDSGLSISKLPASVVDALVVSEKIGLEFVWIDSLCIIQSDDQDKAIEISKMADIYEGAFITISAGSAERCTDGFLHRLIRPNLRAGASFRLPYSCQDGRLGSIILCTDSWWLGDPIDRRAWTMQEHILSRRVIRFSVLGLHWSCGKMTEFYPRADPGKMGCQHQTLTKLCTLSQTVQHNSDHSLSLWTNILNEFSYGRSLTENEDRLPALAGIANRWGELSNDTYLAGIWLSHLPGGLLWSNESPSQPRPMSYSAPSWSWASLEGANIHNFSQHLPADEAFELLSHQIELEFLDLPYGKVKHGSITIRGRVIPMRWNPKEKSLKAPDMDHGYLNPKFVKVSVDVWEDVNEAHECGQQDFKVWLLQLVVFDEVSRMGPAGLVINKDESNKFRRLGTYSYDHRLGFTTFIDEPGSHGEDWHFYEAMIKQQREKLTQIEPTILTIL